LRAQSYTTVSNATDASLVTDPASVALFPTSSSAFASMLHGRRGSTTSQYGLLPGGGSLDRDSFSSQSTTARSSLDAGGTRDSFSFPSSLPVTPCSESFAALVASGHNSLVALASSSGMDNLTQFLDNEGSAAWMADFSDLLPSSSER
jgi:hypothetical protein